MRSSVQPARQARIGPTLTRWRSKVDPYGVVRCGLRRDNGLGVQIDRKGMPLTTVCLWWLDCMSRDGDEIMIRQAMGEPFSDIAVADQDDGACLG